jgi:hypothetical protein
MKIAKVVANPFAALAMQPSRDGDAKVGVPQGVVGLPGARGIWIGARLDGTKSARTGKNHFYFPLSKDGKRREIDINVDDANVRGMIANAILDGSLIAADKHTAKIVGISDESFLPVEKALEAERAKALDALQAAHGPEAKLAEVPTEEETAEEAEKLPPTVAKARAAKGVTVSPNLNLVTDEGK